MAAHFGQLGCIFLAVVSCLKLLAVDVAGQMCPHRMQGTADSESSQEETGLGAFWQACFIPILPTLF